jgi:hypothetical protein
MASGANSPVMVTSHSRVAPSGSPTGPPSISPGVVSMTLVIGLTVANASSHPGIVSGAAKAELAKVSGKSTLKPQVFAASALLVLTPMKAIGQHIVTPNATTSPTRPLRRVDPPRTGTPATARSRR